MQSTAQLPVIGLDMAKNVFQLHSVDATTGVIANNARKENLARARELLHVAPAAVADANSADEPAEPVRPTFVCAHCGAPMIIVQTFVRGQAIRAPPHVQGTP